MPLQITSVRGPLNGTPVNLGEETISFGREPGNTVVIASKAASRHHADIQRDGRSYVLTDRGSSNGTFVNGKRIDSYALGVGDQFEIADHVFRVSEIAAPRAFRLVAVNGSLQGQQFPLVEDVSLGRDDDNTVVLASKKASRYHAAIRQDSGNYVLSDLGSSNGTFVSGKRIESHILKLGDQIDIGDELFLFEEHVVSDADETVIMQRSPSLQEAPRANERGVTEPVVPKVPSSRAQPAAKASYGISCPACSRVIEPHHQHCPWDGASLANGKTVIMPISQAAHS